MKLRRKILLGIAAAAGIFAICLAVTHFRMEHRVTAFRVELASRDHTFTNAAIVIVPKAAGTNAWGPAHKFSFAASHLFSGQLFRGPSLARNLIPGRAPVLWRQESLVGPGFGMTNSWEELGRQLESRSDDLMVIRELLLLPEWHFDSELARSSTPGLPPLESLRTASRWLSMSVLWSLHENKPGDALENLLAQAALIRMQFGEPQGRMLMNRGFLIQSTIATAWQAMQFPGWGEGELARLQSAWQSVDLFGEAERAAVRDRADLKEAYRDARSSYADAGGGYLNNGPPMNIADVADIADEIVHHPADSIREIVNGRPRYWIWKYWWSFDEELFRLKMAQLDVDTIRSLQVANVAPAALGKWELATTEIKQEHAGHDRWFLLGYDEQRASESFLAMINAESQRGLLVTAIAIQRHRLKHASLPDRLKALVPEFVSAQPLDFMDGNPLRYRPDNSGAFLLYSVGEDGHDDGGDPGPPPTGQLRGASAAAFRRFTIFGGKDSVWPAAASDDEVRTYYAAMFRQGSFAPPLIVNTNSVPMRGTNPQIERFFFPNRRR